MALTAPIDCISLPCDLPFRADAVPKAHSFVRPIPLVSHRLSISYQPFKRVCSASTPAPGPSEASDGYGEDVEQALNLDGQITSTSDALLKQVSSRAYDMRRRLEQSIDSSSYDVLETDPWREDSKSVYVLAQEENKLLTMRTRRARSEVENELSLLFPKRGSRRGSNGFPRSSSAPPSKTSATSHDNIFRMVVEDVCEGVLVFEDEKEATQYCSLLDGQGKGCMGVAELDASDRRRLSFYRGSPIIYRVYNYLWDDTTLYTMFSKEGLDTLRIASDGFCAVSGAIINWNKSFGFLVGMEEDCTWG